MDSELKRSAKSVIDRIVHLTRLSLTWATSKPAATSSKQAMKGPTFWNDQEKAKEVIPELKTLNAVLKPFEELGRQADDLEASLELAEETGDDSFDDEIRARLREGRCRLRGVRAPLDARRPERPLQRLRHDPRRGRRHRGLRLGRDAPADVPDVGRVEAVHDPDHRPRGRRRRGHPGRDDPHQGRVRLRLPQGRDRRPPPGPDQPVRLGRPAADVVRLGRRAARDRRHDRHRAPRRRAEARRLPLRRPRRPAPEQDRVGRALHPPADRRRRRVAERAVAAQERRQRPGHCSRPS